MLGFMEKSGTADAVFGIVVADRPNDARRLTMARQHGPSVLSDLRALFEGGLVAGLSDAELLERYAARAIANAASEAAFAVLVDRHGPMVWGVCRQILGDVHEAEDAFQATFLVVARQADRVPERGAVGRWIYGIARRVALRARARARRRRAFGATLKPSVAGEAEREAVRAEFGAVVGEEVARLPARYRAAVELCFLRGMTNEAAARELGWPVGTVKSRLARARERLRSRLFARGLAPAAVAGAAALPGARAAPPAALVRGTVWAVRGVTTTGASGTFPESVAVLAMGVIRAMFVKKVMQSVAALAGMLVAGAGVYAFQDARRGGSAPATERSEFVAGDAVNGEFRSSESHADERTSSVANLVERLARRAAELHAQQSHSEAYAVVRELADVVGRWEARLRPGRVGRANQKQSGGSVKAGSAFDTGSNDERPHIDIHTEATDAGGTAGSAFGANDNKNRPLFSRGHGGSAGVGPAAPIGVHPSAHGAETVEQRLERVEQQLREILKRLDRRADGEQVPNAP
jgi:RNA polymerase sigma factor (sigma-70 family)